MFRKIAVTVAAAAALLTLGAGAALADGGTYAPACHRYCTSG